MRRWARGGNLLRVVESPQCAHTYHHAAGIPPAMPVPDSFEHRLCESWWGCVALEACPVPCRIATMQKYFLREAGVSRRRSRFTEVEHSLGQVGVGTCANFQTCICSYFGGLRGLHHQGPRCVCCVHASWTLCPGMMLGFCVEVASYLRIQGDDAISETGCRASCFFLQTPFATTQGCALASCQCKAPLLWRQRLASCGTLWLQQLADLEKANRWVSARRTNTPATRAKQQSAFAEAAGLARQPATVIHPSSRRAARSC